MKILDLAKLRELAGLKEDQDPGWGTGKEGEKIGYKPTIEKDLEGQQVWMWYGQGPHKPENIGMTGEFGEWVRVGKWLPRIPAQGGYYTVAEFLGTSGNVPSDDDMIEPINLSLYNTGSKTWDAMSRAANAPYVDVVSADHRTRGPAALPAAPTAVEEPQAKAPQA